jgi:hypothetical protein
MTLNWREPKDDIAPKLCEIASLLDASQTAGPLRRSIIPLSEFNESMALLLHRTI